MNRKNILKIAGVLLIAIAMIASTAVTANTVEETNEDQMNPAYIKTDNTNPSVNNVQSSAYGPVIFSQIPYEPDENWAFYTSDAGLGYICADDFWDITEPICDIHWWGLSLFWTGTGWVDCDPSGMKFEIIFYDMAGGPVCTYTVTPTAVPTGKFYSGFEMYYWETDLDPCCQLDAGWVSIQAISSPNDCSFLWAGSPQGNWNAQQDWIPINPEDNLAFELTSGEPEPIPAICCDPGIMRWTEIEPGATVTGTFVVWNCGDDGSTLNWKVDSYPAWMSGAVFTPDSGSIVAPGAGTDVTFTFTAPTQGASNFAGVVKVINEDDPSDYCEMDTDLATPRNRAFNHPFLTWLLMQFPLVRALLGL